MTTTELNPTTSGTNADRAKLFAKMAKVAGQVGHVQKNGYNDFHKYAYVTEADLVDVVRHVLSENGVAFFISADRVETRLVEDRNGKPSDNITTVYVSATFACADTGATYSVSWVGCGADKSDKGLYKAYTGAVKYLLMKTFMISTNDDPEVATKAEAEEAKRAAKEAKPAPVPASEETLASIAKVIRHIELVDDVAGANAQATFEQNRDKIVASSKLAESTLTKLAGRLIEVTEKKATAAQAATRQDNMIAFSAPALVADSVDEPDAFEGIAATPSDKAGEDILVPLRASLARLKVESPSVHKELNNRIKSIITTAGYVTLAVAREVLEKSDKQLFENTAGLDRLEKRQAGAA
jgi:hypothetical protein